MTAGADAAGALVGRRLEHTRTGADGLPQTTRGRCAAAWGDGAYLNCPFTREQYETFLDALIAADQHHGHEFDAVPYFEGCLPVEAKMA